MPGGQPSPRTDQGGHTSTQKQRQGTTQLQIVTRYDKHTSVLQLSQQPQTQKLSTTSKYLPTVSASAGACAESAGKKRALALKYCIVSTDTSEDPVNGTEPALLRIYSAAHLRHQNGNAGLAQDGGLATHIRARHNQEPRHPARVQRHVVGNKGTAHSRSHHRVSAGP